MKKEWIWVILLSLCIIIILPWSILRWQKEKVSGEDFNIRVLMPTGKIEKMALEEYLVGVLAAEMPAEFETEALAAQAIAARTYAAKRLSHTAQPDAGFDVDTTVKTQAWLSDDDMRKKWNWLGYWRYKARLQKAVMDTKGLVLIANGDYIDAFYHSSSGRKPTERAEDVWSSSRPYLQNVTSEEDNQQRFIMHYSFTRQQLAQKLNLPSIPRSLQTQDIQVITRTNAGRVKSVSILGRTYQGVQLRTLLGLSSTDIEWNITADEVKFTTYGNGHAVGMSQYGANDMARKGKTYIEILAHYFPGSKIMSLGKTS